MPVSKEAIGKKWPSVTYQAGREKIREYANAIGAAAPENHEREAAREKGYRDVVAPPMFAVVYSAMSVAAGYTPRAIVTPIVGAVYKKLGGS